MVGRYWNRIIIFIGRFSSFGQSTCVINKWRIFQKTEPENWDKYTIKIYGLNSSNFLYLILKIIKLFFDKEKGI